MEWPVFHWEKVVGGMWEWGRGGFPLTFHENIFMITYMFQRQKFLNDFMLDFLLLNINISIGN